MLLEIQSRFGAYRVKRYEGHTFLDGLPERILCIQDEKLPLLRKDALLWPAGEEAKSEKSFSALIEHLHSQRVTKGVTLVAIGGGSLLDLVGFVAHTYLRGLDWMAIPSTVLAQADSCIGGKTAINWKGVKNQVGAFHPPKEVRLSAALLDSLPSDAKKDGFAEILKAALIESREAAFLCMEAFENEEDGFSFSPWIERALRLKAKLIQQDEFDEGVRQYLNLGHTCGHALESCLGLSHGKSVAWGMAVAFGLSAELGYCSWEDAEQIRGFIKKGYGFRSLQLGSQIMDEVCERIKRDKKMQSGGLSWVLPRGIGRVERILLSDWEQALRVFDKKASDL